MCERVSLPASVHPSVSRRAHRCYSTGGGKSNESGRISSWHFGQEAETRRQAGAGATKNKNKPMKILVRLKKEPPRVLCAPAGSGGACGLCELFILGVSSLWSSERTQPHSSSSPSLLLPLLLLPPPAAAAADTTLKGTSPHCANANANAANSLTLHNKVYVLHWFTLVPFLMYLYFT